MSNHRVTMKELAEAAGVGLATVSAALSGTGRVGRDKAETIRRLAGELGYAPNPAAQLLKNRKSSSLALLIVGYFEQVCANGKITEMIRDFICRCNEQGRRGSIEYLDPSNTPDQLPRSFTEGLCGGVLIIGQLDGNLLQRLRQSDIPFVHLEGRGGDDPGIRVDYGDGVRQAVQYLAALGHRRIGFVAGCQDYEVHRLAADGYRQAVEEFGLDVEPRLFFQLRQENLNLIPETITVAEHFFARLREAPTALIGPGAFVTQSLMVRLLERGLRVPDQVSVICCYPAEWEAQRSIPALTAVEYDIPRMIDEGLRLLDDLMVASSSAKTIPDIRPVLRVRESTARIKLA